MTALPVVGNSAPCWLMCLDCRAVAVAETDDMGDFFQCPQCETLLMEPERVYRIPAPTEDEWAKATGFDDIFAGVGA